MAARRNFSRIQAKVVSTLPNSTMSAPIETKYKKRMKSRSIRGGGLDEKICDSSEILWICEQIRATLPGCIRTTVL